MPDSVTAEGPTSTSSNGASETSPQEKRNKRIQLSCTSCRHRKLKCNRIQPCDNCVKRGQAASCFFANPGPRKTPAQARLSARNNELQQRLTHLEELVISLSNRDSASPDAIAAAIQARQRAENGNGPLEVEGDSSGRMVEDPVGTRYVDAAHWKSMLDEITQVREFLEEESDETGEVEEEASPDHKQGTLTLLSSFPEISRADLLAGIPSRKVVDQLVTRWFNGRDPSLICVHVPTFMKEYDDFWKDPWHVAPAWMSLLYSCIYLGTSFFMRSGVAPPSDLPADSAALQEFYLIRSCQALAMSDYTKPGKHKLEALLIYFGCEYIRSPDAQVGLSFLVAIANRLAMISGYHRDPKNFPEMSPFEGEMRRRTWALCSQIETLVSFQVGIPRTTHDYYCDTEPPRNLHWDDFGPDSATLPPSRPENERTSATYQIGKGRIMSVFGVISDRAYSREKTSYDEVMLLDMRLREAYDSLPSLLKVKPLSLCLTDPPELVMQRYNLQFLFQKGRCVLHRRCFSGATADPRCVYSKRICVEAAMDILKHQKDLYDATQPGGILRHDTWYISSLTTHDFITAAMILCLWLSREAKYPQPEGARIKMDNKELFEALDRSYQVWNKLKSTSYEATKAASALKFMLGKTRAKALAEGDENHSSENPSPPTDTDSSKQPSHAANSVSMSDSGVATTEATGQQDDSPGTNPSFDLSPDVDMDQLEKSAFNVTENLLSVPADTPLNLDWDAWDASFRSKGLDPNDMSWLTDPAFDKFANMTFPMA